MSRCPKCKEKLTTGMVVIFRGTKIHQQCVAAMLLVENRELVAKAIINVERALANYREVQARLRELSDRRKKP